MTSCVSGVRSKVFGNPVINVLPLFVYAVACGVAVSFCRGRRRSISQYEEERRPHTKSQINPLFSYHCHQPSFINLCKSFVTKQIKSTPAAKKRCQKNTSLFARKRDNFHYFFLQKSATKEILSILTERI